MTSSSLPKTRAHIGQVLDTDAVSSAHVESTCLCKTPDPLSSGELRTPFGEASRVLLLKASSDFTAGALLVLRLGVTQEGKGLASLGYFAG
jgi:hypothetical protein